MVMSNKDTIHLFNILQIYHTAYIFKNNVNSVYLHH